MTEESRKVITEIAAVPTISSGNLLDNNGESFELHLNIRKYFGDVTKKGSYSWRPSVPIIETNGEIKFRSMSPDCKIVLIGRVSGEKDKFIEIWGDGGNCFLQSINVSNDHGDFSTDDVFGSFTWSLNGNKFAYIAEKKSSKDSQDKDVSKFVEIENFGERLQNIREPVLCVLDLSKFELKVICDVKFEEIPQYPIYPAQPAFIDNDNIVLMGIEVGSKKLGMTYIYCRPTLIYLLNLSTCQAKRISDKNSSARSPIVSKDGKQIAYLKNSLGRSHFKASQLILYDIETSKERIIIDIVKNCSNDFPGLFCQRLPAQRFGDKIILNSCWFDSRPVLSINIKDGSIKRIMPNFGGSMRILDIRGDHALLAATTCTNSGKIFIMNLCNLALKEVSVQPIENNSILKEIESNLESSVIELNSKVHIVLLKPKSQNQKLPLLIVPHGGPNSVYSVDYVMYPIVFARMGYAVASINYTGSIGFGDESIEDLEGQIGVRDVEDCYLALQSMLKSEKFDKDKVVIMGGSHGGYLTAHLSAKYPEMFIGAILRNPVIDLPSMTVTSDIADWTFGQLGINLDQFKTRAISEEEMKLFQDRSPSKYAVNVKCPTLVMLGALDLRVPPSQGRYWAHLLKANGVDCQVLHFPDANHGLETADSERIGLEAILNFFRKICL